MVLPSWMLTTVQHTRKEMSSHMWHWGCPRKRVKWTEQITLIEPFHSSVELVRDQDLPLVVRLLENFDLQS